MSASVHSLFPEAAAPRRERYAVPMATAEDLARRREVMGLFTPFAPVRGWIMRSGTPAEAMARILDVMGLSPLSISVEAQPATPDTVEIRDERDKHRPRHILALVHEGLNIAEARAALDALRNPNPKGRR